jgi:hypothetical protein
MVTLLPTLDNVPATPACPAIVFANALPRIIDEAVAAPPALP